MVLGFKKVFTDRCENVLAKEKKVRFFFPLAVENRLVYKPLTEHCSVCNCFPISTASIPTPCELYICGKLVVCYTAYMVADV